MARMQWRIGNIVIGLALLLGFSPALAEPTFPALTGRVVDNANLLDPADEQALTTDLKALEDKSSDQLVVVTIPCKATPSNMAIISGAPLGHRHEARITAFSHRRAERRRSTTKSTRARADPHDAYEDHH
jgi:hypothetical protein